jgi:hypothetical protein
MNKPYKKQQKNDRLLMIKFTSDQVMSLDTLDS